MKHVVKYIIGCHHWVLVVTTSFICLQNVVLQRGMIVHKMRNVRQNTCTNSGYPIHLFALSLDVMYVDTM